MKVLLAGFSLAAFLCLPCALTGQGAASAFTIDASAPAPVVETGFLHMGGSSPSGHRLAVNSRYLSLDGRPWLPVAGEFHFSRYPEKYWAEELGKMKADGLDVVDTYLFWIHHEEVEGQFDWTGQRDLRHFVELCGKSGLKVYLRVGPWAHGEARNGGFPDWLVKKKIPLRRNDPEYMRYVSRYFGEVGKQVKGQLWQDGGPIIGVQIENEYGESNPDASSDHLTELKRLAVAAGINPPLFSITGWPERAFAEHEFVPAFGGYPDDFWSGRTTEGTANEAYLFSTKRAVGDMGAMTGGEGKSKVDLRHYPYFTAEQGGGMETSYQRRPLIDADDIAALTLTGLGSGINLYGYYMFHGGTNPEGKLSTLQESIASGYPNDLPVVSYDFQAPLGEYGQERESFRKVKSLHLFVRAEGAELAQMAPYAPAQRPKDAADLSMARVMLRANGERGFLFANNYVRKHEMAERKGFQVQVKLAKGAVKVPHVPIDVPANSYFVWPVNLDLGAGTLRYGTAQLLSRVEIGGETNWFFFAVPGVGAEFALDAGSVAAVHAESGTVTREDGCIVVRGIGPGRNTWLEVAGKSGRKARIVLLTEKQAEQFWQVKLGGVDTALLTEADVFADGEGVHLRSVDRSRLAALAFMPGGKDHPGQLWQEEQRWKIAPRKIEFEWAKSRDAAARPAMQMSARKKDRPQAPEDADFAGAAAWTLTIPQQPMEGLSDIFVRIHYAGDEARLSAGGRLLDDDFYNGRVWEIGMKRFLPGAFGQKLQVEVLPLPHDAPVYLDARAWAQMNAQGQTAGVTSVEVMPEYEVVLRPGERR